MSTEDQFQYDIAFSFLDRDEPMAIALADKLREQFQVFVYSERQKELAGKDGLTEFSAVFKERARLCVILYREGWGQTKWTRVEETAIKERAFDKGWDFLVVIALDSSGAPVWLPKTKLWLGMERFGPEGAEAVIDARATELGATTHIETNVERAARLEAERERTAEHEAFLASSNGVNAVKRELGILRSLLKDDIEKIGAISPGLGISYHETYDGVVLVRSSGRSFTVAWSQQYANSLRYSHLSIKVAAGPRPREGQVLVKDLDAKFAVDRTGALGWNLNDGTQRIISTQELVNDLLRDVVDHANDEPQFEQIHDRHRDEDDEWLYGDDD